MDDDGKNDDAVNKSRYRSPIWQYFEIESKKDWTARCNFCNKLLSFRSATGNLKKHLTRKHGEMIVEKLTDEEEEEAAEITFLEEDDGDQDTEVTIDKRKILRSGVWAYFEVHDEEDKIATCTICREQFSYRTTSTNLARHLKRKHCIEFEKSTDDDFNEESHVQEEEDGDDDDDSDDKNQSTDKRRNRTSAAWEYFTIEDPKRRVATCKLCASRCSYLTSVSNLMKHVRCKHRALKHSYEDEDENAPRADLRSQNRSSVWLYFRCVDAASKVAVCLICKKQLSHLTSITNLKKHLYRKHPGVQLQASANGKKMLISSDGQLYEIDDNVAKQEHANEDEDEQTEPLEMNAIYLDDYESGGERKRQRKSSFRKPKRTYLDETTGVTETISSDEEITFQKRYVRKKHDSLDQFGIYLVSLLKQLPKELSNQLQADFVKQVMAAQLNYESQKVVVTQSNGYAITITESRPEDGSQDDTFASNDGNS